VKASPLLLPLPDFAPSLVAEKTSNSKTDDMIEDPSPDGKNHEEYLKHTDQCDNTENITRETRPNDDCSVPLRFLRDANEDEVIAKTQYEKTLAWRQQENIDNILSEPHPHFDLIKKHYPHYTHLRGKHNEVVYYEYPPKMDLAALKAGGVTMDILLRHYMMVTEFLWSTVELSEEGKCIYVMDLEGVRLRDFAGDAVSFLRQTSELCGKHYPGRTSYIFVINAPYWFSVMWNILKGFVGKATLDQVQVVRGQNEIRKVLAEHIDAENIPPVYGGSSMPLGNSPEEKMLADIMTLNNR